jgi:transcriptional regulator with XRE-family HTH domain
MEFGNKFKQLRKLNGLTQKQVADILMIKQSNISDWENNVSRPEYENLIKLSKLYDESIDCILNEDDTTKTNF